MIFNLQDAQQAESHYQNLIGNPFDESVGNKVKSVFVCPIFTPDNDAHQKCIELFIQTGLHSYALANSGNKGTEYVLIVLGTSTKYVLHPISELSKFLERQNITPDFTAQ